MNQMIFVPISPSSELGRGFDVFRFSPPTRRKDQQTEISRRGRKAAATSGGQRSPVNRDITLLTLGELVSVVASYIVAAEDFLRLKKGTLSKNDPV